MNRKYSPRFWLFPIFALMAGLVLGGIVMLLWNVILPDLLHVSPISYWQSVGLLVLFRILVGNFGRGAMSGGPPWKRQNGVEKRAKWREKWANMTDEERVKLREEWRKRCGK